MSNLSTSGTRKNLSSVHSKDTLHCLLIPLQELKILLPNTAVAEVIGYITPEPVEDAPDWLLGNIIWRDEKVPLLSFERVNNIVQQEISGQRIAVLNTLNANPDLPYLAILIDGIPQLRLVQESSLVVAEKNNEFEMVAASIELSDEKVFIPDMDKLEQQLVHSI